MDCILISDFSTCRTLDGKSIAAGMGWELVHYKSQDTNGVMLYTPMGEEAEDLIFKFNKEGWYRIMVGIYNHDFRSSHIKIKLSGDEVFRKALVGTYSQEKPGFIEEGFWKAADLTGQDLVVRKVGKLRGNIAYLKLIQMSESEMNEYGNSLADKKNYKLGAVFDVGDLYFNDAGPFNRKSIHEVLEPFVNSDFSVICWGTTNSTYTYLYHTKIGEVFGQGITDFYGEGMRKTAEFMDAGLKDGWDPFAEAVDYCHKHGMQLYADYRIEHTYDVNAYNGNFTGKFQKEHQHCRMTNRDGSLSPLLSLAYGNVCDYKVAVLTEMAEYGVDGVYIDFGRSSPVVSYDPPIVEGFMNKYGKDPRKIHPHDLEWIKYRAGFVTEFMKRLRQAVLGVEKKLGKNIKIAAQVEYGYTHTDDPHCNLIDMNLVLGYDLEVWAKEGLVDIIAPALNSRMYTMYNLDYYKHILKGTDCELWIVLGQWDNSLFPLDYDWQEYFMVNTDQPMRQLRQLNVERLERNASDCYAQGVEGLFLWEAGDTYCYLDRWEGLSRLGHKNEIIAKWGKSAARFDQPPKIGIDKIQLMNKFE